MKVNYQQILMWHSALNETINGYNPTTSLEVMFGDLFVKLDPTFQKVRGFMLKNKDCYTTSDQHLELELDKSELKIITLSLEGVLEHIADWEIPLRLDVTPDEIKQEVRKLVLIM